MRNPGGFGLTLYLRVRHKKAEGFCETAVKYPQTFRLRLRRSRVVVFIGSGDTRKNRRSQVRDPGGL